MYESQFGLKRRPFGAIPDPRCFMSSGQIQAALDELVICVEQGQGIAVVTAPAGTGKTLLCERIRMELADRFETVLLRHGSFLTRRALLQTVLCELNHSFQRQDEQELRLDLIPAIRALSPRREALVVICDEAHLLTIDLLEELRTLSDLAEQGRPLVRLVLVGQVSLEETLAQQALEALNQRIRAHVCLETFDRPTSRDYIDYRLTWGGGRTDEIFTSEAMDLICQASGGVPRCLNQLCDHTLLLAYVAEEKPVTVDTVREALQDLRQLPLHWNESLAANSRLESLEPRLGSLEHGADDSLRMLTHEPAMMAGQIPSIEIGAGLTDGNWSASVEVADSADSPTVIESSITADPDPESVTSADDTGDQSSNSAVMSEIVDQEPQALEPPLAETDRSTQVWIVGIPWTAAESQETKPLSPGEVVEELVWDKYAAIDGGFVQIDLSQTDTMVSPNLGENAGNAADESSPMLDTSLSHQDSSDVEPADPASIEPTDQNSSGEQRIADACEQLASDSMEPDNVPPVEGFDMVCQRLDEKLPEVHENPGWNVQNLDVESLSEGFISPAEIQELQLMEVKLAQAVCELSDEIRLALDMPTVSDSLVEQLQAVAQPQAAGVSAESESGLSIPHASTMLDSTSEAAVATVTAPATTAQTRPFRNLFSMLRRKQQGLL